MVAVAELTVLRSIIYLSVRAGSPEEATEKAIHVFRTFLGHLYDVGVGVRGLRVDMEEPQPVKDAEGVWLFIGHMRAEVPDTIRAPGATNPVDAWRYLVKDSWVRVTREFEAEVWRQRSYVTLTRPAIPGEDQAQEEKPAEPKRLIPITVTLKGQTHHLEIPESETLLDGVLDKGLPMKFNCKAGVCDECQIRVIKGMENLPPPNEAEHNMLGDKIKQGYRLSCQISAKGPVEFEQN